jgi:hypothetical protein
MLTRAGMYLLTKGPRGQKVMIDEEIPRPPR